MIITKENNTRMRMLCPHCIIENDKETRMRPEVLGQQVIWLCEHHVQFFPDIFFDFKPLFLIYKKKEFRKEMKRRGVIKRNGFNN